MLTKLTFDFVSNFDCTYVAKIIIATYIVAKLNHLIVSGIAPITNGMATVTVNGLECGVTYTIIAGGTLNRDLVGPRSSHGAVTTGPCPTSRKSELYTYVRTYVLYVCS